MTRLFYALVPDSAEQTAISAGVAPLREAFPQLAWVPTPKLHVTLRFLGNVPPEATPALQILGANTAKGVEVPKVHLRDIGTFPNLSRPRVVWIGMTGPVSIAHMASELDRGVREILRAPSVTRPFRPHLTLARVRVPSDLRDRAGLMRLARTLRFEVEVRFPALTLMQSLQGGGGSAYLVEDVWAFAEPTGGSV